MPRNSSGNYILLFTLSGVSRTEDLSFFCFTFFAFRYKFLTVFSLNSDSMNFMLGKAELKSYVIVLIFSLYSFGDSERREVYDMTKVSYI